MTCRSRCDHGNRRRTPQRSHGRDALMLGALTLGTLTLGALTLATLNCFIDIATSTLMTV